MATNKNQHFVPRCYLKEFTNSAEDKAINVYNLDRKKFIPLAPVKNQCSRDYFYGNDDHLEEAIQSVERGYAFTLKSLLSSPHSINKNHELILKRFWLLQYMRTEASSKRATEVANDMSKTVGLSGEEFNLKIKEAVLMAMRHFSEIMEIIDDLKICIIHNKTSAPFITSDDPAVLSNRWHLNDIRTKYRSFGLHTCGNLLFLPLSPKFMCIFYDSDVYSIPNKNNFSKIIRVDDVKAFNQQQIINSKANVFIKDQDHRSFLEESIEESLILRPEQRHRINYAIFDYSENGYTRYKVIDPRLHKNNEEAIIHIETIHSKPNLWPSIIFWKYKGVVYTNGTGLGYIRKSHIPIGLNNFKKEPSKLKMKNRF